MQGSKNSLYTDGVLAALFTPVSDQVGAVSPVLELHLGLESLDGSRKPEAAAIKQLNLNMRVRINTVNKMSSNV